MYSFVFFLFCCVTPDAAGRGLRGTTGSESPSAFGPSTRPTTTPRGPWAWGWPSSQTPIHTGNHLRDIHPLGIYFASLVLKNIFSSGHIYLNDVSSVFFDDSIFDILFPPLQFY